MRRFVPVVLIASCASSEPDVTTAKIESLEYAVPAGWKARDLSNPNNGAMFEWTPDGANERKESLVVSRVPQPALAKSRPHLRRVLGKATQALPLASFHQPTPFVTRGGLSGVRTEGRFTPPGKAEPYHRTHAVLADKESLVHVLYTARDPDREHIGVVLDGFKAGE